MSTKLLYILLPVHNRRPTTRKFIECLAAQTFEGYHLLLIDDGSTDGTADMVKQHIANHTVIRGTGNWWWAGCLQRGLDWLKAINPGPDALVLFINDDVRFAPDYLERAVNVMKNKRGTLLLSQFESSIGDEANETGIYADLRRLSFKVADSPSEINCLSTRGLFGYWADIQRIGGFHPVLLPHYLSDYEYTIRAFRKGLRCETSPDIVVTPNSAISGIRALDDRSFVGAFHTLFSKRSAVNPIYWSTFMLLAASPGQAMRNLARIWGSTFKHMFRILLSPGKKGLH